MHNSRSSRGSGCRERWRHGGSSALGGGAALASGPRPAASAPLHHQAGTAAPCLCCPPLQTAVTLQDRKGDSLAYPKVVRQLPFSDTATTAGLRDDYGVVCGSAEEGDSGGAPVRARQGRMSGACMRMACAPGACGRGRGGGMRRAGPAPPSGPAAPALLPPLRHAAPHRGPTCAGCLTTPSHLLPGPPFSLAAPTLQDAVYYFKPAMDVTVTASLCGSSALPSTFDARLFLLAGVDGGGALRATACSNDACGKLPALTVRRGVGWGEHPAAPPCAAPGRQARCGGSGEAGSCWRQLEEAPAPAATMPADAHARACCHAVQAALRAGVGYAFVVDGVGGASGKFSIRQASTCPFTIKCSCAMPLASAP